MTQANTISLHWQDISSDTHLCTAICALPLIAALHINGRAFLLFENAGTAYKCSSCWSRKENYHYHGHGPLYKGFEAPLPETKGRDPSYW